MRERSGQPAVPRHGLARVLSKRGICSRTEAARWILEGRVSVDGRRVRNPELPIAGAELISIDGHAASAAEAMYLVLNKPRGLVTTTRDEHARDTVYSCFRDAKLPWLAPVGRLDKASEGLLLFSNDPGWAARITGPGGPHKTYDVQIDAIPESITLDALRHGVACDGEWLRAHAITLLRSGSRNAWLRITLDEGRNRQIRRLLAESGLGVLRLVRIGIGPLALGDLAKGAYRMLSPAEVERLAMPRTLAHAAVPERDDRPAGMLDLHGRG